MTAAIPLRGDAPLLVRDVVHDYLRCEGPELQPRSLEQRRRHLLLFAEKYGDYPVAALRKSHLRGWVRDNAAWSAAETKRSVVISIKRCFSWAVQDDLLARNPFAKVGWESSEPRRPLTPEEFGRCLRASDATYRRVLIFLRFSGARPGELAALEWPMVDLAAGVCELPRHKHKTGRKTGEARRIYLPPILVKLLCWLARRRVPDQPRVFFGGRGQAWTSATLSLRFWRLRRQLGLPRDAYLYGLRHTFGTASQLAGNDLKTTAELLGHKGTKTTERYYVHLREQQEFLLRAVRRATGDQPPS